LDRNIFYHMKLVRIGLFWMAVLIAILCAFDVAPQAGIPLAAMTAFFFIFLAGNLLGTPRARVCATLTVNEILQDTLDAFAIEVPMLMNLGTDFSTRTAKKGDQIIAHISSLPTVRDYDATDGYGVNQAEAEDLLTDVPVTVDQLKHVPVRVKYLTQLASRKNLYVEAVRNMAYVLGKSIVDAALAKTSATNFSREKIEANANLSLTTLEDIRGTMNTAGALNRGRYGLLNSSAAAGLSEDARVTSGDFYGQLNGAEGYRRWVNIAGFGNVWEYPGFPANSDNQTGFFADRRAIAVAALLPDVQSEAAVLGVPAIATFQTVTNPESGFSVLAIRWQKQGTFDIWCTLASLYGTAAGSQGGSADTKTDKAGVRLVSA
jgi:hypothetical protein